MKRRIRLTESDLHNIIKESVKMILTEGGMFGGNDTVRMQLISNVNGNMSFTVPYNEFINTENKFDYLWQKCSEQNNNQKLYNNGYFAVDRNDPHKDEIEQYL